MRLGAARGEGCVPRSVSERTARQTSRGCGKAPPSAPVSVPQGAWEAVLPLRTDWDPLSGELFKGNAREALSSNGQCLGTMVEVKTDSCRWI